MGKDEGLSMTEIFNPGYRKYMGEFFLVKSFAGIGILMGSFFFFIPGIVISIAWSLAPLLVLDKGVEPVAAIKQSNELTYGHKWTMFLGQFIMMLVLIIAMMIISSIGSAIHSVIGGLLGLICIILIFPIFMGIKAYIYRELTK
jgi:uncharacterized membrane protein